MPMSTTISRPAPIGLLSVLTAHPGSAGPWYDCTSVIYGTSTSRRVAAVTFGQKGYVRQDVYERFGSNAWARIMARSADGSSGRANGRWSPDSVWESGCIEFNN